jgi:hypothetical protein
VPEKSDEQRNRVIRLLAGHEVELEDDQRQEGDEREHYVFAAEMRTDADVNAWIRRRTGRT